MTTLMINQAVPDFSAMMTGNQHFQLANYLGKANLVIYFYPKDNTAGCTTEAQQFRDHAVRFQALETVILGVSRDSLRTHENFKAKHQLPFELVADTEESVCQLFEVIKLKTLYGKQYRGIERSTFLIDKAGILRQMWRKVNVTGHVEAVLAAVSNLNTPHSP